MARLDGAKKTSQARVHYNRTLCSKVRYKLVSRELGAHIPVLINWHLVGTFHSGWVTVFHTRMSVGISVCAEIGISVHSNVSDRNKLVLTRSSISTHVQH